MNGRLLASDVTDTDRCAVLWHRSTSTICSISGVNAIQSSHSNSLISWWLGNYQQILLQGMWNCYATLRICTFWIPNQVLAYKITTILKNRSGVNIDPALSRWIEVQSILNIAIWVDTEHLTVLHMRWFDRQPSPVKPMLIYWQHWHLIATKYLFEMQPPPFRETRKILTVELCLWANRST